MTDRVVVAPVWYRSEKFRSLLAIVLRLAVFVCLISVIIWSVNGILPDRMHFRSGLSTGVDYISRMFPHGRADWRYDLQLMPNLIQPLIVTIQMAVAGTALGACLAFPISFLAARTDSIPRLISGVIKTFLNISRAIPTMIYALIVITGVGLGAFAGAVAIGFVSFVSLAKLFAETLESVSVGPIEAVRAVGGNPIQIFMYAMLPQVFPTYLSTTLYTLEYNIKESFIVGIVGAGGLGYELMNNLRVYKLLDVGVIVLWLIILVNIVDYSSYRIRQKFA